VLQLAIGIVVGAVLAIIGGLAVLVHVFKDSFR